jgi:DHA1 family multidrug resistance protein-like MFS transporter
VPILVAEFVALVGFGALLPVLPLYVVDQGVDTITLGVILAAWPAARLVFEPIFGWLADRTSRRGLMLAGMSMLAVTTLLPIFFHGPVELFILRFLSGIAVSMYDPAARGTLVEETDDDERGEAFGLYSAAQMGGLIFGPVVGAFGAVIFGGFEFAFVAAATACVVAAIYLAVAFHPRRAHPPVDGRAATADGESIQAPLRELWNRPLVAVCIVNFGLYFAVGVYEVIWALYLQDLGGSVEWIGVTYMLFALPVIFIAPMAGRLVDRHGAGRFVLVGALVVAATGLLYAVAWEPYLPGGIIVVEATADAFLTPAMFAVLAIGTPRGRAATAQGVFGAVGTVAFIASSLLAGWLFSLDSRYPFLLFAVVCVVCTAVFVAMTRGVRLIGQAEAQPQGVPT